MTQTETETTTDDSAPGRSTICERCHGRVSRTRRSTLTEVLAVHAASCPGKGK